MKELNVTDLESFGMGRSVMCPTRCTYMVLLKFGRVK
jgi:hypothetical protein